MAGALLITGIVIGWNLTGSGVQAIGGNPAAAAAPAAADIHVLGPAEAPLALIRGRHRFRLLVHGRRNSDMQAFVRSMLERGPKERRSIQVQVDVDPQSFF